MFIIKVELKNIQNIFYCSQDLNVILLQQQLTNCVHFKWFSSGAKTHMRVRLKLLSLCPPFPSIHLKTLKSCVS